MSSRLAPRTPRVGLQVALVYRTAAVQNLGPDQPTGSSFAVGRVMPNASGKVPRAAVVILSERSTLCCFSFVRRLHHLQCSLSVKARVLVGIGQQVA